jgi:hypothetical protein
MAVLLGFMHQNPADHPHYTSRVDFGHCLLRLDAGNQFWAAG